jgi:hypothetical protein
LQTGLSQKKVAYLIYAVSGTLGLVAASLVHQQKYFLMLAGTVLVMAFFFAEVLNRHRQRRGKLGSANIEDDDPDEKKSSPVPSSKPRLSTGKDKKSGRVRNNAKKASRIPADEKIKKPTSEEGSESLRP